MCGRFAMNATPEALAQFFQLLEKIEVAPRFNIAPTQDASLVRIGAEGRSVHMHRWGLLPGWAQDRGRKPMINARAETVFERAFFRSAARQRRCLIPATGFYEWRSGPNGKQPVLFRPAQAELMALAGLWETWTDRDGQIEFSFAIVTTRANETVAIVHDRMPVLIRPMDFERWLDPEIQDPDAVASLLVPAGPDALRATPLCTRVNNVRNDDADCWAEAP